MHALLSLTSATPRLQLMMQLSCRTAYPLFTKCIVECYTHEILNRYSTCVEFT